MTIKIMPGEIVILRLKAEFGESGPKIIVATVQRVEKNKLYIPEFGASNGLSAVHYEPENSFLEYDMGHSGMNGYNYCPVRGRITGITRANGEPIVGPFIED